MTRRSMLAAALLALGAPGLTSQQPADYAAARQAIAEGNRTWGQARVALDRATFERMLLPDFYVQLQNRRLTRQEFIDNISTLPPGVSLKRFDASVLTVAPDGDTWVAVIQEKLEMERTASGEPTLHRYALWITRDVWKQVDGQWRIASSTEVSNQAWPEVPPIPGW